jgi:uncharacterized protein YjbI with pentapeptide repeats
MLIENEITVAQLLSAYANGQRVFKSTEIIGEHESASLSNIDLQDAEFSECWFHSAYFSHVNLKRVKFQSCNLKCSTFEQCDLSFTVWEESAVCSLAVIASETTGLQASKLDAYGAEIENAAVFLEYAEENAKKRSHGPSEA